MPEIIAVNVNSIASVDRRVLLENFLSYNKCDVVFLSETKLYENRSVHIHGFTTFNQNRTYGFGGGTAILIKNNIKARNYKIFDQPAEATAIEIFVGGVWIRMVALYLDSHGKLKIEHLKGIFKPGIPTIMGGDLNARMTNANETSNNHNGVIIRDF